MLQDEILPKKKNRLHGLWHKKWSLVMEDLIISISSRQCWVRLCLYPTTDTLQANDLLISISFVNAEWDCVYIWQWIHCEQRNKEKT